MNLAEYPVRMDARVKFRVFLITGETLKLIDQLPNSVAKTENLQLFEENANGTLEVDVEAMQAYWENIQKIEITVGHDRYRPYMNDILWAQPVSKNIKYISHDIHY